MIEHVSITYEAFDGTMFDDDVKCIEYEVGKLYEKSGIRFINADGTVVETFENGDLDRYYEDAEFATIDRSKMKENMRFYDAAVYGYGWILLGDMLKNTETAEKYRFEMDKMVSIE